MPQVRQLKALPFINLIAFVGHCLIQSLFPSHVLVVKNITKTPYLLLANSRLPAMIPIKADKKAVEIGKSV